MQFQSKGREFTVSEKQDRERFLSTELHRYTQSEVYKEYVNALTLCFTDTSEDGDAADEYLQALELALDNYVGATTKAFFRGNAQKIVKGAAMGDALAKVRG